MPGPGQPRFAGLHDVELCAHAATGERRAFGELVRRHGSAVRALLRRMGAQPAEFDDLAQDAFIAAFERIAEFRGEGTFVAWVKRIAARLYLRRLQREKRLVALSAETEQADIAFGVSADGRIDLDEALKILSEAERLCVTLCFGAGLSHGEAAEALNLPLGTVKSHVKRGLERLRARLAPPRARFSMGDAAMAEVDFERRLERLFGQAPELVDASDFAARIERRLNAGWNARRWVIGAAGVVGGLIAASQLMMANLFHRADVMQDSAREVSAQLGRVVARADWLTTLAGEGGSVVWVASALAIVAMAFVLSRVIEEI